MGTSILNREKEIIDFHLPRWSDIPDIELYLDQVISFLEKYLSHYLGSDNEKEVTCITKTMVNNYVKHKVINPPVNKKYNREHIAYLIVIFILKQVYSINDIKQLIQLAIKTSSVEQAYNQFCFELEKAILYTFQGKAYSDSKNMSQERYILRNVVQTYASKLYALKIYLNKA